MHMYSNPSNANAAAKKVVAKFPGKVVLATPERAPSQGVAFFYACVARVKGAELSAEELKSIDIKVLDADATADVVQADEQAPVRKPRTKKGKAKKAKAKKTAGPKKVTITEQALDMMRRDGGATSEQLQKKFGWQPHSVRGFVSNENRLRNRGIVSVKAEGKPTAYTLK